ncbi:hypothetical protein Zmor_001915 [Zophobas morio]|uniref:Tc1-like transposase DDE domain-containing protein n=2 Tax=Zophobas morio TaxID=2755281 RepID=A0AA38MSX9_9CUCU|nr:hypothetical protein Zmor_001915 [Zophobas morio]
MGYKWKKFNNRKILIEQPHIIAKRIKFLKKYLQYLQSDNYIFVFLDETWIYENESPVKTWVNESDPLGVPQRLKGEGRRFTILHAGTARGFLKDCDLMLGSDTEHRDYHKNMNAKIFTEWIEKQLLPALNSLDKTCVIVLDNAPYHSEQLRKLPVASTKKRDMTQWLQENNIPYPPDSLKSDLWAIIRDKKQFIEKTYAVDDLIHKRGHIVLRLPPYNCQYNPIELAWGFIKTYYSKHIPSASGPKLEKTRQMWSRALENFTPDMWANSVRHCEELIREDWKKLMGNLPIDDIPPIIIQLSAESDSEDDWGSEHFESDSETE